MPDAMKFPVSAVVLAALVVAGAAAAADGGPGGREFEPEATNLRQALEQGLLAIDLRYRFEFVDSGFFDKDAYASTLRGVLGYETDTLYGFSAGVSFETVTAIGNDQLYNNLGAGDLNNGVTDRPVVADPALVEVDQIYLAYAGRYGLEIKAGRFAYTLDNWRFIGVSPWRQNRRSYEALSIAIGSQSTLRARYAYLGRAYYNNGLNPKLDAHLLHLSRDLGPGAIAGYAYLLDWGAENRALLSSATYGLRYVGSSPTGPVDLHYFAEYARQLDYGDNPNDFGLDYAHLGLGVGRGPWRLTAAWELRDGDGTSAVLTPLGSNHGKNGYADRINVSPPSGTNDFYAKLTMDRKRWSWLIAYHYFQAALGDDRLGSEIDFVASYKPSDPLSINLKIARYDAGTFASDVTKVMLWSSWSFDTGF